MESPVNDDDDDDDDDDDGDDDDDDDDVVGFDNDHYYRNIDAITKTDGLHFQQVCNNSFEQK